MVTTNQKVQLGDKIRDSVFEGNIHAQGAYFREAIEVLMFYQEGNTPNPEQQEEINKRLGEFKFLNKAICEMVGKPTLEELGQEVTEE